MVKGISKQVIVVHSPDPKLFEQAIFILRDDALHGGAFSQEQLLSQAKTLINMTAAPGHKPWFYGPLWGLCGAAVCCAVWLLAGIF